MCKSVYIDSLIYHLNVLLLVLNGEIRLNYDSFHKLLMTKPLINYFF